MLYHYLRFLNYIFTMLGIRKPFLTVKKEPLKNPVWNKIWSIIVIASMIVGYILTNKSGYKFSLKKNLNFIYTTNDMIINILVIILFVNKENLCVKLYEGTEKIFDDFNISETNIKMFSIKIYLVFFATTAAVISVLVLEIMKAEECILFIILPTYLSTFHLVFHLFIILAILKLVTIKMSGELNCDLKQPKNNFLEETKENSKWKYLLSPDIKLFQINMQEQTNLKFLCRVYDDLCTCIQLLEQYHSVQMLFTLWLMFTNAVFGITIVFCKQAEYPLIVAARSILPFPWCFIGSFINDQINKQVEQIDMIIIKCLIDFRCDQTKKNILQTFKQLIGSNRLQFSACSLFRLNYATILGTIVNVITYSIIVIQLFLNDQ